MLHLVPVHAHLVAPDDRLQPIPLAEPLGDVGSELEADAALAGAPAGLVLRVGPQHLHHQPGLARLPLVVPVQLPDVVQGDGVVREQTAVEDEVLGPDEGGQGQSREALREELEHPARAVRDQEDREWKKRGRILPLVVLRLALTLEAVDAVHVVRLVVAAVEEEGLWPQPLVRVQQQRDLCRPRPPVDEVSVEEVVVLVAGRPVPPEQLHEIEVLA